MPELARLPLTVVATPIVGAAVRPPRPLKPRKEEAARKLRGVRSVRLGKCDDEEELFDAVVVANGHYLQPRVPSVQGQEAWTGRQMHSHSYRTPEPFRGEVVVVGCGESGKDIAMDLRGVAKEVHLVAKSMEDVTPGLAKVLAKHGTNLHIRLRLERLCEDGRAVFGDGSGVLVDAVVYCTGYDYSFPFPDTAGAVTVDDNRVGPLFEHVFPPSLAPSLSFIGIPIKVFTPWFFEAQARWVAQVLSGKRTLPSEDEMLRSVEEWYRSRETTGTPKKYTHDVSNLDITYMDEFEHKYCDFPRVERWNFELLVASYIDMVENLETFRDDYQDTTPFARVLRSGAWPHTRTMPLSSLVQENSRLVLVNKHNDLHL
uniref:Uncharacterized protein n=1 Tax=Avena sativa TaxID=4498 RepID=A0ACD5US69_AVESA